MLTSTDLHLQLHHQRSTELQRSAAWARLASADRDRGRAERLAARAGRLLERASRSAAVRPLGVGGPA